ncbi:DUF3325 domain-containing protein [Colwellia psychrerythraea]|uniref:DUF3325 domain-containing protein n=1 Tax=Colwellia psychrerythraea (strain 34H / ATCC BAA-681) TaxID=167879 RepID=Q48A82_COLP3|nr:DUF3325 domain-containing protein [Colwellia psychrerythraea]AAZ24950.1 hypothetical protein CPS_0264 [Colwellia psychrerythraea 34H]
MFLLTSLSFLVMVLFCLAMNKHREQVLTKTLPKVAILLFRPLAWLALLFIAYLSVALFGWSIGPAFLFGALTMATLLLIMVLTYRAKIIPQLALASLLIAGVSVLSH